jgi:hypothetical protein
VACARIEMSAWLMDYSGKIRRRSPEFSLVSFCDHLDP